jgi:hypothetical protein
MENWMISWYLVFYMGKMKSFINVAFTVHADMKSHTGGGILWGFGIILSMCQKQKLNSKSSTEAEIIGVSDFLPNMIWARMFLEHQGGRTTSRSPFSWKNRIQIHQFNLYFYRATQ